ncbi:MAG: hypothetical protein PHE12_03405 [Clostridia bacterium]|nr:hypothetical protein [Clostridia bacterium]
MKYSVIWSKTLLYSLCRVKGVCRQIDNAVEARAAIVPGFHSGYVFCEDAATHTQKMISLIEQKKRTINLLLLTNRILDYMTSASKKALVLRYCQNKDYIITAQLLNFSVRTFFRHIKQGLKIFTNLRKKLDISDEYLEGVYKGDYWITQLKNKALTEERIKQKALKTKKTYTA